MIRNLVALSIALVSTIAIAQDAPADPTPGNWQYANAQKTVVNRLWSDGRQESVSVDDPQMAAWLATGCDGGPCAPDPYVAPPAPPPSSISRPQFYQQLAVAGIISQDEALGALAGVLPPPLATLVAQLPAELQFRAKMKLLGAQNFEIADPVTQGLAALAQANGIPIELGQFFTDAAKL